MFFEKPVKLCFEVGSDMGETSMKSQPKQRPSLDFTRLKTLITALLLPICLLSFNDGITPTD